MSHVAESAIWPRHRVSAAVLHNAGAEILMVKHRRTDGSEYWQLPGGGILPGEEPEVAVLRELLEETGLHGRVVRFLFTIPYKYGDSSTYLVHIDAATTPVLGYDPEEINAEHQKLVAVAWVRLSEVRDNPEIRALLDVVSAT